jgi:hypothetical protein
LGQKGEEDYYDAWKGMHGMKGARTDVELWKWAGDFSRDL